MIVISAYSKWLMAQTEEVRTLLLAIRHTLFAIGSFLFQPLLCQFNRLHHGPSLIARLFILVFRIRVRDDAGSGLNEGLVLFHDDIRILMHMSMLPEKLK